ncbi:MAG: hypothetical protein SRB1_01842 [Desulfobacteraceae bacterium Eth-SRB1]|nr:MAG: hypothetical protein SRB1_01842 [Desulfobacteraceae bacterium Eth-SRB1]
MYSKIIFFMWLIGITVFSVVDYYSMSRFGVPKGLGTGFWLHLMGYFIAGALYFLSFGNKRQRMVLIIFIGLFLLGVVFEIVQIYVPHRAFNPKDIAANGLGLAGVFVCHLGIKRFEKVGRAEKQKSEIRGRKSDSGP